MRQDDADRDKVWFRAARIFHADSEWYVGTREGNLGPFPDRQAADIGFVLWRHAHRTRRQHAFVVEEHTVDTVTRFEHRLRKAQRAKCSLGTVGGAVNG